MTEIILPPDEIAVSASFGEIVIDGWHLKTLATASYDQLAIWLRRTVFGNPTLDDDDYISSIVIDNLTGGSQADKIDASKAQRFWRGLCWWLWPNRITLPPMVDTFTFTGAGTAMPLGDYPKGDTLYTAFGTSLRKFVAGATEPAGVYTEVATLPAPAVAPGIVFNGTFYIPHGSAGYSIWNGATITSSPADPTPIEFLKFDNLLWAFEHNGQVSYSATGAGGSWTSPTEFLLQDEEPRRIHQFRNSEGIDAIVLTTSEAIWYVDPYTPKLWRTKAYWPHHTDFGHGASVFHAGEDLYVPQGLGIGRYNGADYVAPGVGLDRDQGLPTELRGHVQDMLATYNLNFALVHGAPLGSVVADEWYASSGRARTIPPTFARPGAISSLFASDGRGWGQLWQSDSPVTPNRLVLSSADCRDGFYRLMWGADSVVYHMELDITFLNPEEGFLSGKHRFAPTGFFETGRYFFETEGIDKLLSHIVSSAKNATDDEHIHVSIETDRHSMAMLDDMQHETGRVSLRLGLDTAINHPRGGLDAPFSRGELAEWAKLRVDFMRADSSYADQFKTPILDGLILKFVKFQHPTPSFSLTVVIPPEGYGDHSAREIVEFLDHRVGPWEFIPFNHKEVPELVLRAKITSLRGLDVIGSDRAATRDIVILDVRDGR